MADKGFTVQKELGPLNAKLNIPSLSGGRAQLTEAEVKESQTIASVQIHVERTITKIKKFKALNLFPSYYMALSIKFGLFHAYNMNFPNNFNREKPGKLKN